MCFGKRLSWLRARCGWTQEELALKAGCHPGRIANIETGRRHAPTHEVERLAEALDVTTTYLIAGTDWSPDNDKAWLKSNTQLVQSWFPQRRPVAPSDSRIFWHLTKALERYPETTRERWHRVLALPDCGPIMRFMPKLPCDSDLEGLFLLELLALGCLPFRLALSQLGFSSAPVRHLGLPPGASEWRYPGLALDISPELRLVFLPQIRVGLRKDPYRLDCLLGVIIAGRCSWLNLEVDGFAHDGRVDDLRTINVDLDTARLKEADVLAPNLLDLILARVEAALNGAPRFRFQQVRGTARQSRK